MKKIFKYFGIALALVLPIAFVLEFGGILNLDKFVHIYNLLCCGFYGSIIVLILAKSKLLKTFIVLLNIAIFAFLGFGALMGGLEGLMILGLYTIIPFYSFLF